MAIVGGFDVHRSQITFDFLDTGTGEVHTGRIAPATRESLRRWLHRFTGHDEVAFALEGCTGWRFVVEELTRAGIEAHVAEPADTAMLRGPKRRAKSDRADARLLRELLTASRIPESWIPPTHVLEVRTLGRLYLDLNEEYQAWVQRLHAQLFHQGVPPFGSLRSQASRDMVAAADLSPVGRVVVDTALAAMGRLRLQQVPIAAELRRVSRVYPGPRVLTQQWGIGPITAPIIWAEMGDTRRFASSDQAVRHTGLDITVYASAGRRAPGHLSRQGPPALRWALVEAAQHASKPASPDHAYYRQVRDRIDNGRAMLSVARRIARRVHHQLRALGDDAWEQPPATTRPRAA